MQEEAIRVETHQIKEGTSFYGWAVQECSLNTSLYNRYRKEAPDVGLRPRCRGWGFTHCLDGNINTLSLTA